MVWQFLNSEWKDSSRWKEIWFEIRAVTKRYNIFWGKGRDLKRFGNKCVIEVKKNLFPPILRCVAALLNRVGFPEEREELNSLTRWGDKIGNKTERKRVKGGTSFSGRWNNSNYFFRGDGSESAESQQERGVGLWGKISIEAQTYVNFVYKEGNG